jgi:hypothetical protein
VRTYALVIVKRAQYVHPMLLLLNGRIHDWKEAAAAYADYLNRWNVETEIRLWKQTLDPAVAQLMTCDRIQGLLHLQTFLLDFLLRETEDGRDPFGCGLHEILHRDYLPAGETLTYSPYVVARAIRDRLRAETASAFGRRWLSPASTDDVQLPLLTRAGCVVVASFDRRRSGGVARRTSTGGVGVAVQKPRGPRS